MAEYRYHFYDLRTGAHLDTLPLEEVTFSTELCGVGTLSGGVPLFDEGLAASRVLDATIPDRTKVYVERDNALVWGGRLVPPRKYDSGTGRLSVAAEETLGALGLRFLPNLTYTAVDQLAIARSLVSTVQAEAGGDVGLDTGTETCGVLRDRSYLAGDKTAALTALTNLSEVEGGFEFATAVVWDETGAPSERLLLGYPSLGRAGPASALVLEYDQFVATGGNVISYTWDDGPGLFTRSWATCDTEDGSQLVVSATNLALLSQGYPLLEQSQQFDGITNQATLQAHANALAAYAAGHHVTAQFTVHAQPGMEVGDWQLGDTALVRISDHRFPPDPATGAPGFAGYLRIVGVEVTPGVEGEEQYAFTMADMLESL